MDGACSCSSRLSCPAHTEREGGQGAGAVGVGQGKTDGVGVYVCGRTRQMGKDCNDIVGVRRVSAGPFGTV
jgi:hypothetical protein